MAQKRTIPRNNNSSYDEPSLLSGSVSLGFKPDEEIPNLPRDLTSLSDQRLMNLFSEYVSWQNYAATEFARCEVEEARADAAVRYAEASVMILSSDKETVTKTKATMINVPDVQAARDRALEAYAARKMTSVVHANCERCVSLISRELTRRVGREGPERRNSRWNP